jgi:hypothetical protein
MAADQLQITRAQDGSFVISAISITGGMGMAAPQLFTARNAADMAAKARELFEGPREAVPALISEAFDRDATAAMQKMHNLLTLGLGILPEEDEDDEDDEEEEDEGGINDPLEPSPYLF